MKTYTSSDLLNYARKQVDYADRQSLVIPCISILIISGVVVIAIIGFDLHDAIVSHHIDPISLLTGFSLGILLVMSAGILAFSATQIIRRFKGIEYQLYKRLIALETDLPGDRNE